MLNGHGDDLYRYNNIRLNFSSNVFNHFDHEGLFCHLADKLDNVMSYPEPSPQSLEREIAMMLDLSADEVMVTNGATEGIYLIAQTFRHAKSAILQPTFSEYADACRLHEHQITNVYDLHTMSLFNAKVSTLVWLCNPNNPTGAVANKEELQKLIEQNQDTIFIIDASYAPFTDRPLLTPKEGVEYPNVLMLHSMTKEFAVPGLRIGYVSGNKTLLHQVKLQRMPWSVNQVAIDAAHYLLSHKDEYEIDLQGLLKERARMAQKLTALGVIEVWPSDSHILLCKLRIGKASALKDYLAKEHGMLIRDAANFASLDETFFRIAVQTPEEDDELLDAITEWIAY